MSGHEKTFTVIQGTRYVQTRCDAATNAGTVDDTILKAEPTLT